MNSTLRWFLIANGGFQTTRRIDTGLLCRNIDTWKWQRTLLVCHKVGRKKVQFLYSVVEREKKTLHAQRYYLFCAKYLGVIRLNEIRRIYSTYMTILNVVITNFTNNISSRKCSSINTNGVTKAEKMCHKR